MLAANLMNESKLMTNNLVQTFINSKLCPCCITEVSVWQRICLLIENIYKNL